MYENIYIILLLVKLANILLTPTQAEYNQFYACFTPNAYID